MSERLFTVQFLTIKNNFCYLSTRNKDKYIRVSNGKIAVHFSVNPLPSMDENNIGFNSLYSKALGFNENDTVTVTTIDNLPTITSLTLSPVNRDDYEVLELLADNVQSTLLNQIRVLQNGQDIIIWMGQGLHVTAAVSEIKPISPGIIDNLTEVVIKTISETAVTEKDDKVSNFSSTRTDKKVFRLVPISKLNINDNETLNPFNVFISDKLFDKNFDKNEIYSLSFSENIVYVKLHPLPLNLVKDNAENLFINDTLLQHFNCEMGARCILRPHRGEIRTVNEIEICTKKNFIINNMVEKFKEFLVKISTKETAILNSNKLININNNLRCFIRFQPVQDCCLIDSDFIRNCKFSVSDEVIPVEEKSVIFNENHFIIDVGNYENIINDCLRVFSNATKLENILIEGKSGTGKSTLIKIIEKRLLQSPYFIHCHFICCKNIKGKTIESLHKLFTNLFFNLLQHQPSVLFIDDLHVICENIIEGDIQAQNIVYHNSVSEMLQMTIDNFRDNGIGIIATCESLTKLNKHLHTSRGEHIFKNLHTIQVLQKNDRENILKFSLTDRETTGIDFKYFANKTENFVMQDLVDFASRCIYESYIEDFESPKITEDVCGRALKSTTTLALSDIPLHSQKLRDFSDIGGLNELKEFINETMLGPVKYPNLFANPPIRLPTGLLLFGAPGTGKTLIAGAAARHCGLRLISIKGPELLSKYIGASEQAVREVFLKAQNAKPCILFFDEFDSLAPRRGHDNTGVTDRVVNQLLTQLDGVEVLSDVWVLAATSRPDLLDPALLRPGRLDRQVLCPLPTKKDRMEILKALSKSIELDEDIVLEEIAEKTEGYSGADLQSILYSAQMAAVDNLDLDKSDMIRIRINRNQIMEALKKTRPSLSKDEREKFGKIYERFQSGQLENFVPGSKATLA